MMRHVLRSSLFILAFTLLPLPALALMATDGFAIYSTGSVAIRGPGVRAIAVQPWDGKVVIGGEFSARAGAQTRDNLARLNTDGTLDASFDQSPDGPVHAIAISWNKADPAQSSILVGGRFAKVAGTARNSLSSIRSGDATLESFDPISSSSPVVNALLLTGAGEVVVGGEFSGIKGTPCSNIAMLSTADGSLGSAFGGGVGGAVSAIALQKGKVVIGGSFPGYLARFDSSMLPDATLQVYPNGAVRSLAVQTDGMILFGGDFTGVETGPARTFGARNHLARSDGTTLDTFDPSPGGSVGAIAVQPDGNILIGGTFTALSTTTSRLNLARLKLDGTPEAMVADTDQPVRAIALQPDGKFLAGGDFANAGGRLRSRLARFYPHGALDHDMPAVALALGDIVITVAQQPEGTLMIGGGFARVQGKFRDNVARLTEARNLDLSYNPALSLDNLLKVMAVRNDGGTVIGGDFTAPQTMFARLDALGYTDHEVGVANYNLKAKAFLNTQGNVLAIAPVPPIGQLGEEMFYVGGDFTALPTPAPAPYQYLNRVTAGGERDTSFSPASVSFEVHTLAVHPDGKVLVGGTDGAGNAKLLRLNSDGALERDYMAAPLQGAVNAVFRQSDGRIVAVGSFTSAITMNGKSWERSMLRFNADGSVDDTFNVEVEHSSYAGNIITGGVPQADGSMIIYGIFNSVKDSTGAVHARDLVARVTAAGKLDPDFNVGAFTYAGGTPVDDLSTVNLQPDGKVIMGGEFSRLNGKAGTGKLTRVSNGWATQELSVSTDGSTITWRRAGTGPELAQVYFDSSDDAVTWNRLGHAQRVEGGWQLGGQALAAPAYRVNRYVRARGYLAGDVGGGGSLIESVRLYYLEPQKTIITVTADERDKRYGDPDPPLSYSHTPALFAGDAFSGFLSRTGGEDAGSYQVEQWTLALDEEKYVIDFKAAPFVIRQKEAVIAAVDADKFIGAADPVSSPEITGIFPADLGAAKITVTVSRDPGESAGSYALHPAADDHGTGLLGNYSISYDDATFTIKKLEQGITFAPMRPKTFGDGDFDPGATASSALPVGYASSAPAIALVAGGRLRVVSPGSAVITASQEGNEVYGPAPDVARPLAVNPPPWNGLGLDGMDDAMAVANAPQLNFGGKEGFSIEAWVKLDGSQPDGTGLVSKAEGGVHWSGYQLVLHHDRIAAEIGGGGAAVGAEQGLLGTSSLNDGRWHHVALSVDRAQGRARLYFDGRVEAELSHPALSGSPDNLEPLRVGTERSTTRYFKGEIDEVRLWGAARSREEIRAQLSQIIDPALEAQLAAYFHLDEGDVGEDNALFPKAPERTAYAADGTLQGFALAGAGSNWIRSGAFLPLLETAPVTSVTGTAASAGLLVYPNYYPANDVGLCWKTAPGPTLADSCSRCGSGTGPFAGALTGLTPGATYYVRGYAVNQMGTAYGNEVSFLAGRLGQSISMTLTDRTYGDPPFDPGGTSTSGLPVTYASSDPEVAIVAEGGIVITGAGSTVITARQGGDEIYDPAPELSLPLVVKKAPLRVIAEDKFRAYLTPNPELTVAYRGFVNGEQLSVLTGAPALTTAATTASGVGSYPISTALDTLAADNYSLLPVNGTLSVFKSCQEINFPPLPERTFGDPPFEIIGSACSGLPLRFTSSDPAVAQVNGRTVTITGAGSAVITASQQGGGSLEAAPDSSRTFIVHKSGQLLSFSSLARKVVGDPPFILEGSASSGLAVSYRSSDPGVAAVSGNLVTVVGAGTAVISAQQAGDLNYLAALPVSHSLTVAQEGVAPLLALSTLASGAVTSNPVLNVMGGASDASGIATLTVQGGDRSADAALFSSAVSLATGDNTVSVSALDGAGNRTTQTLSITLDALAPALAVAAPADNSVTDLPTCAVSGSVTPGSAVTLWVNGDFPQLLRVEGGSFTGTGTLSEGVNTVELSAELSGRSSRLKRSVTYAPGAPAIAITYPAQDMRTEQQSLTLRGRGGGGSVRLDVNGITFTAELSGGLFQQQIDLPLAGENRIKATASGSDGVSATAFRNIIRIDRITGDLDGSGSVDIQDASALLRISLGLEPATTAALAHGDVAPLVDGVPRPDGVIDVGDLLVLLRRIVGLAQW